ncbi:MAG: ATP synthase F1 subunit delta [Bacteroidales bacterium]|nr:ATP synthase F1 subunit delta [Bacteroidales bacterium]
MNEGIITARYAKALFHSAEEEQKAEIVHGDIFALSLVAEESPEFIEFLESPIVKETEKIGLFEKLFQDKIDTLTFNFLELLVKNKREQFLPSICRHYISLYKEKSGVKEATIITATPLFEEDKQEIKHLVFRKLKVEFEMQEKVDPSIIGGFILRIEDQQIDASISSKLKNIKAQLINS